MSTFNFHDALKQLVLTVIKLLTKIYKCTLYKWLLFNLNS